MTERHYCTYFDQGFLIQGFALWQSLRRHEPEAVFWVLALDEFTGRVLRLMGDERLRVVALAELEGADPELARLKSSRSRVEYYFTLSPCWPRYVLKSRPEISQISYLDADLFCFGSLRPLWAGMDLRRASVLITAHRFGMELARFEKHGRFNVGILSFRRDQVGLACLDYWRSQCLVWCYDRLEDGKYADQKYLEAWPERWGDAVWVCANPGVNAAPWNWTNHRVRIDGARASIWDGEPLVLFHFARLKPIWGTWWWQSGQIEYGVMPWAMRQVIYGPYGSALEEARQVLRGVDPSVDFNRRGLRLNRRGWQGLPLRLLFGGDWLRWGNTWISGRMGLGRYAGKFAARLRTIFLRP